MLRETGPVGRYAFTHALVRATLYDGALPAAPRAAARPRRRGDRAPAQRRPRPAPAAARPPLRAGRAGRAARARDRLRARRRPPRRPAAGLGGGGRALPRRAARARAGRRAARTACAAELLLALGASEDRAGMEDEARATFAAAADDRARARRRAAARPRRARLRRPVVDPRPRRRGARRRCSRRRSTALGGEDSPLRARLLARLALELYYSGDPERRLALSEEAVELARRLGDPRTLAVCLDARHYALWRPENVNERLEVASELRRVAEETGDPELELEGAGWTVVDLLELGDVQGADIQIAAASKLAEALQRPIWLWWSSLLRCTRAQLVGDFDEAERLADATLEIGRHGQAENAVNAYAQAMFNIRREQGRLVEVEPAVRRFIEHLPDAAGVACRAGAAARRARAARRGAHRVRDARRRRAPARRELADRGHAARRGLRCARRRRARRGPVRAARAVRGAQRRGRPRGDLQRRRLEAARDPRRRDAGVGVRRGPLHQRARDARADGGQAVGRAHPARLRRDAA